MDVARYGRRYAQFLRQLRWISKLKPLSLAYRLATLSAYYQSPYVGNAQRVKRNIAQYIDTPTAEIGWQRFMQHTGIANCNIFRIRHLNQQWINTHVELPPAHEIQRLKQLDKPIFLMIYHQHHPFLLTVLMGELLERAMQVLAMTPKNTPIYPYVSEFYEQYFIDCAAHYHGGDFFLVDDHTPLRVVREMHKMLQNKQLIVSLNDVFNPSMGERKMDFPFYHSMLPCPVGAVEIALRYDVEIVTGWVEWIKGSQFKLVLHTIDPSQGVENIMQQYIDYLKTMIAQDAGLWEGWKFI